MPTPFSTLRLQLGELLMQSGTADPTEDAGVSGSVGSPYWRAGIAGLFLKTGDGDTAWTQVPSGVYLNVRDFGATGDGTTDDTEAVQAAIDAASVIGGVVYFPPGVYLVAGLMIDSATGVRLLGCGWAGSILKHSVDADGEDVHLVTVSGSTATVFEGLTFDGSGLTNAGAESHLVHVTGSTIVKILVCRVQNVASASGAAVYAENSSLVHVYNGYMTRSAGGALVELSGTVSRSFVIDSDLINDDGEALVIDGDTDNIQVMGCHLESGTTYALRCEADAQSSLVQVQNNVIRGFAAISDAKRFQFLHNALFVDIAGAAPCLAVTDCTESQFSKNLLARLDDADAGKLVVYTRLTHCQIQSNQLAQDTVSGVVEGVDLVGTQIDGELFIVADAGESANDGYLFRSVTGSSDLVLNNLRVTAASGTWANAIRLAHDGAGFAGVMRNGGILRNCAVGLCLDEGESDATAFLGGPLMFAGGIIDATTDAILVPSGVYYRIGGNASTFGANDYAGRGGPNSVVTARAGSTYRDLDATGGDVFWVKESGTSNTGWVAK